ncbi:hypothetical protein J6590_009176 [Homalodisca vitripennis]|nr:hypothetical protein J6590_009176 [Homalodisca vitripennis]
MRCSGRGGGEGQEAMPTIAATRWTRDLHSRADKGTVTATYCQLASKTCRHIPPQQDVMSPSITCNDRHCDTVGPRHCLHGDTGPLCLLKNTHRSPPPTPHLINGGHSSSPSTLPFRTESSSVLKGLLIRQPDVASSAHQDLPEGNKRPPSTK